MEGILKPRGRPKKVRLVGRKPQIEQFSPRGKPGRPDEAEITIDQLETLRLVDYSGMSQIDAAKSMGLSRQTVGRILKEARRNITDGLINGKIIRICGGKIRLKKEA